MKTAHSNRCAFLRGLGIGTSGAKEHVVEEALANLMREAGLTDREQKALTLQEGLESGERMSPVQIEHATFVSISANEVEKLVAEAMGKIRDAVRARRELSERHEKVT
ncbi:MAG: hypothetical protein AAB590_00840 [Patescibacteria group bacterium]